MDLPILYKVALHLLRWHMFDFHEDDSEVVYEQHSVHHAVGIWNQIMVLNSPPLARITLLLGYQRGLTQVTFSRNGKKSPKV